MIQSLIDMFSVDMYDSSELRKAVASIDERRTSTKKYGSREIRKDQRRNRKYNIPYDKYVALERGEVRKGMVFETFSSYNYTIRASTQSRLDASVMQTSEVALRCVNCSSLLPVLDHGESVNCDCGAILIVYGAGLSVLINESDIIPLEVK